MDGISFDQIQEMIKTRKQAEGTVLVKFEPHVAAKVLKELRPELQRGIKGKTKDYADAMRQGDWSITGDTVKFSDDGYLLDGQNRLYACVLAEAPFTSHVIFGVNSRSFRNIDWSNVRTKEDTFYVNGAGSSKKEASVIAKGVTWHLRYANTDARDRASIRPATVLDIYESRYTRMDALVRDAITASRNLHGFPAGQILAVLFEAERLNKALSVEFRDALAGRVKHPRAKVFKRLIDHVSAVIASGYRVRDTQHLAWFVETWNAFAADRTPRQGAQLKWHYALRSFPRMVSGSSKKAPKGE
jgi:hypothetical protein